MLNLMTAVSGGGQSQTDEGYGILTNPSVSRAFFDWLTAGGDHLSTLSSFSDLSGNSRNLTSSPSGYTATAPKKFNYKTNNREVTNCFSARDGNPFWFATNTTNPIFATSHEVHMSFVYRGQNFIAPLCGINVGGVHQVHYITVDADGKISIYNKRSTNTTRKRSVSPVFTQGVQNTDIGNICYIRVRLNYTSGQEQMELYANGVNVATELVSGDAISSWNSSYSWTNNFSYSVGAVAGSASINITSSGKDYWIYRWACTNLLTQDQANKVAHTMMLQPSAGNDQVRFIGDFDRLPHATTTKEFKIGVYLTSAPGSNVNMSVTGDSELSISGSSLTFTSSDYNIPQMVKVTATLRKGYKAKTLTFSYSGGLTGSLQKTIRITESYSGATLPDGGTDYLLTDGYCSSMYETDGLTTGSDVDALEADLQSRIFKGSYPSGAPSVITPVTNFIITLGSAAAKNSLSFVQNDIDGYPWTNLIGDVTNSSRNNKLFVDFFGHSELGHQALYDAIKPLGYDYGLANLAVTGTNSTTNPTISGGAAAGHNQMFTGGLDRGSPVAYMPKCLFHFDKIRYLEWVITQRTIDEIYLCGVSGGAQSIGLLLPLITNPVLKSKITKVFLVRGFNSNREPGIGGDYEQGGPFYTESTGGAPASETNSGPRVIQLYRDWPTLKIMLADCRNRTVHHLTHQDDQTGGGRRFPERYELMMQQKALALGGSYNLFVNDNAAQSAHGYQADDIAYIVANL